MSTTLLSRRVWNARLHLLKLRGLVARGLAIVLLVTVMANDAAAQTGVIYGEVLDAATGETLPGASVVIEGTTHGTATDIDGRYTLRAVPAGDHVLVFSYMGYISQEFPITVVAGERVMQNVDLQDDMIHGEDILIVAQQRGQARALTRQRQSINIRNIISAEQMDSFVDQDVSGALSRIAGMGHGGANIRGIGPAASNITMDGQRMGSTGSDRSVNLGTISADMVQELDVIKVITPDMDAESMSGVINVSTRRPIGGQRTMNIRVGGGYQDRFLRYAGGDQRASISYGESPTDNFSYGLNLSYQRVPSGNERNTVSWEGRTFDDVGRVDVVSDFRNRFQYDVRDRYGASLQMTFQPTERSTYHVQSMFNYQDQETTSHTQRYTVRTERYTSQIQTGPMQYVAHANTIQYEPSLDERGTHQYTVQVGARHLLDRFDMEYYVGWGHGRLRRDDYSYVYRTAPMRDWIFNLDDRRHITIEHAPHSEQSLFPHAGLMDWDSKVYRITHHRDNEFTGKLDFERPYRLGKIKFGASGIMSYRTGWGERFSGSYERTMTVREMPLKPNARWNVFEREHESWGIPWIADMQKMKDLLEAQFPNYQFSQDAWLIEVENSIYDTEEQTYGTYVMGNVDFNRFSILGGVRVEHYRNYYFGRETRISEEGRYMGAGDVSSSTDFTNIFPNLQMLYALGRMTNIRLAYSRSIGRPTFGQLSPNIQRNYRNETIREGNPNLDPMLSNNLDFIIEHYFMNVGQLSLGLYYKDMSNFVYQHTEIIRTEIVDDAGNGGNGIPDEEEESPYEGWRRTTFLNGEEATAYGIETSWQQRLEFLPGFLGNFGIYANYAYAMSAADIGRRHPDPAISDTIMVRLRNQRPHVVNAGLSYVQGRFNSQITYQWGSPSISSYGSLQWVPEIHQRHREYFDAYRDAANNLSMTVRYRISSNFRIWADASNMLNNRSVAYNFDRDYYPISQTLSGRRFNMGLRYTF